MRIVVALGGNALARRGEPMTADRLRQNVRSTCAALADVAREHELVITHGNGPQVGLLALQNLAYHEVAAYPLDILGAETQGMIGYVVAQELRNALVGTRQVAALVTTAVVSREDPAFAHPTKPIGPQYSESDAREAAAEYGWTVSRSGDSWRRVVPSPDPQRIVQTSVVRLMLEAGFLAVCVGGGGVPVVIDEAGRHQGVEAVVDKDLASAVLAAELGADLLVILTDADYVYAGWGGEQQEPIRRADVTHLRGMHFEAGSMGPKVEAACRFAEQGGRTLIGALDKLPQLLAGETGTEVVARLR